MTRSLFFTAAFFVACLGQGFVFFGVGILDEAFWSDQARYAETGSPEQYNPAHAYGHPGGPVILGTIAVHHIAGIRYETALPLFLTMFNGVVIAAIATLCWRLRPDSLWWMPVLGMLSIDKLYAVSTPTSALAGPLLVLLTLLTLRIVEEQNVSWRWLAGWSLVAGLAAATRFDIGGITTAFLLGAVTSVLGTTHRWRQLAGMAMAACAVFVVSDPYMWYMPVQHLGDLLGRIVLNYRHSTPASTPATLEPLQVVSFSALAFLGMVFTMLGQRTGVPCRRRMHQRLVMTLALLTVLLYGVFLSARCPAVRYFIPIVFIWQVFLPLELLDLVSGLRFPAFSTEAARARARQFCAAVVVLLLVGSQLYFLIDHVRLQTQRAAFDSYRRPAACRAAASFSRTAMVSGWSGPTACV